MKRLLKKYSLFSDMQYFEMIATALKAGQLMESENMFKDMPRNYRKCFVKSIYGNWNSGISDHKKQLFIDLI